MMKELFDYYFYSKNFQKIKTKMDGLQPLILRHYQRKFMHFWDEIEGPERIIVLKPRQCGLTTIVCSRFSHNMCTRENYRAIVMADKKGRTSEMTAMHQTFLNELPPEMTPLIHLNNTEQIFFENPNEHLRKSHPGLKSGIRYETGNDPNAGRSGTRQAAHISEAAFIRYMKEIDDGIQNSVPLAPGTTIIKESTANGRAGIGKPFYDLWQAAKRGDSIYKPFFVAWYEVDDYAIAPGPDFILNKFEIDLLKRHPALTVENLVWRRLKITEYLDDEEESILTPEERFKQDFPINDREAFLSTGAPVFDPEIVTAQINRLNENRPTEIQQRIDLDSPMIQQFLKGMKVYTPSRVGKEYFIGADISEGLAMGDASSCFVMDREFNQVARWHGKIDPDMFGHLLIAIGEYYNNALIIPENNNMGHTTVTTIKNEGYPRLYSEKREDLKTFKVTEKLGWTTTASSKMDMLNEGVRTLRDGIVKIRDVKLFEEMTLVSREENGKVSLNGRDRVVAYCLALMGRKHFATPIRVIKPKPRAVTGTGAEITKAWENGNKKKSGDIFG